MNKMEERIQKNELKGYHACWNGGYGDWTLYEVGITPARIRLKSIKHLLTDNRIQSLKHEDISWKGKDLRSDVIGTRCMCCGGRRYVTCDISIPCIVLENVSNPHNLKYRMIDGKHRMMKMKSHGQLDSMFYVPVSYTHLTLPTKA